MDWNFSHIKKWLLDKLNLEEKKPEEKRLAVLVDHLNIVLEISPEQKKFMDYNALSQVCRKHGKIIFKFTFIPENYQLASSVYNFGFWPIQCLPKNTQDWQYRNIYDGRYKDRVDNALIEMGLILLNHTDIDELIVVFNDGDYSRLVSKAKDYGKVVHLICGEKVSSLLVKVADTREGVPFV